MKDWQMIFRVRKERFLSSFDIFIFHFPKNRTQNFFLGLKITFLELLEFLVLLKTYSDALNRLIFIKNRVILEKTYKILWIFDKIQRRIFYSAYVEWLSWFVFDAFQPWEKITSYQSMIKMHKKAPIIFTRVWCTFAFEIFGFA